MSKKQEIVTGPTTEVAIPSLNDWGTNDLASKDIVIPKIYCMQGLSDLVAEDKAKMGDFIDSLTSKKLGSISEPLNFIPFHMEKLWEVSKQNEKGDFEFATFEPVTAANIDRAYENNIDGINYKYKYTMRFYVLLENDSSLPYIISFKGTSTQAGKVLATQMFVKNKAAGKVPPAFVMSLAGRKDKNDKGTFAVMEVCPKRETTPQEVNEAFGWFKTINQGGVKIHEAEPVESEPVQQEMY